MRQRDHHLLSVLDNMPAMIGYWDKNLRNRFGNRAYATWFGISPTKMLGMHLKDLLGEQISKLNWPYVEAALRGERQAFERSIPSPDGKRQRHSLAEYIPDIVEGEVQGFYVHVTDVSALKESVAQHQRAEEKFKTLFDSNQDAILLADKSGYFECNQSALTLFGCTTKEELFLSHPVSAFWPAQQDEFDIDQIVQSGKLDFESHCSRLNPRESFPVRVRLNVITFENKQALQIAIRDIAERKKSEKALEINKKILDTTTEGFWLADAQGQLQTANQAYSDLIGYSREELQHMHISQLEASELSKEAVMAHAMRIIELGSDQFETRHRHKDGHLIDIEVTTSYLQETRQFAVFSRDITQRKKIEAAVHESEERLRGLFDLSTLGIALADMSGQFIQFNAAFSHICGYPEAELKHLNYWKLTPAKYSADEQIQMETLLRTGRFGPHEKEYLRKDGSLVPVRLTGMSITKKGGDRYIWAIAEDITQEKLREQHLMLAKETAEMASKTKSTFLSAMTHELRTPMNGVMGMAQLLQLPDLSEAERQEFTTTLLASAGMMMDMISMILEYSDIETKADLLRPETCMPSLIVSESVALMSHLAENKGLALETSTGDIEGHLYTLDSARLRQMLSKLLDNAIKFTELGHVKIEARVIGFEGQTAELEFAVVDTGIGIPHDKQHLLFEAFSQVDASSNRRFGGIGLGLATVKRLIDRMKGTVGVESEEGKGSRFWFRIKATIVPEENLSAFLGSGVDI
jgi:PAS domain S-box-containing protein